MAGISDTARLDKLVEELREKSEYFTEENYHTEAAILDSVLDQVDQYSHMGAEVCLFKVLEELKGIGY